MSGMMQDSQSAEVPHGTSQPEWFIDEGIPGPGNRPEWLDTKYKTMADKARAHKELEKMLGSTPSAPDSYDLGEYAEYFDTSNSAITEMLTKAKTHRLSQDALKDVVGSLVQYQTSLQPDFSTEVAKLGEQGALKVETFNQWAKNNLSQPAFEALSDMPQTAEVFGLMDEIRQMHVNMSSRMPSGPQAATPFTKLTLADVRMEMENNMARYEKDEKYRAEIKMKFEQVLGS